MTLQPLDDSLLQLTASGVLQNKNAIPLGLDWSTDLKRTRLLRSVLKS